MQSLIPVFLVSILLSCTKINHCENIDLTKEQSLIEYDLFDICEINFHNILNLSKYDEYIYLQPDTPKKSYIKFENKDWSEKLLVVFNYIENDTLDLYLRDLKIEPKIIKRLQLLHDGILKSNDYEWVVIEITDNYEDIDNKMRYSYQSSYVAKIDGFDGFFVVNFINLKKFFLNNEDSDKQLQELRQKINCFMQNLKIKKTHSTQNKALINQKGI
jgi:hypothetical protein